MNFFAGTTVVADDVTDVTRVEELKRLDKFLERHALQVARVSLAANTLIWRVEIDQIARPGPGHRRAIIFRAKFRLALQQKRRTEDLLAHGFRQRAHAAIVGTLIKFAMRVVTHSGLHAPRQQIQKMVRTARSVKLITNFVVVFPPVAVLRPPDS